MRLAVNAVIDGRSLGEASNAFSVPKATLMKKVKAAKDSPDELAEMNFKCRLGRKRILSTEGLSIKYVTHFWPFFRIHPPPCNTL